MALTKRSIDALVYDPAAPILWDGKLRGYGVRVFASGAKSFILDYRAAGSRKQRITIGRYGVLTPAQARSAAEKLLGAVADGRDPAEERRERARAVVTFGDLARRYIDEYARLHRKTWREDERRLGKYVLPRLARRPADKVTAADLRALHAAIGERAPVEANRVVGLIRAIYNRGKRWGLLPETIANPATRVDRFQERSRERWLTAAELKRLARAVAAAPYPYGAVIRLLLLTGCRKTELLRARWDRLDLEGRRLLLEDTKTGAPKVVPLSAPALEVLRELPRALYSPWIFPSDRKPGEPLADLKRAWRVVKKAASLPDATVHDLRRTSGSWLVQRGVPLKVVGAALGHRDTRSAEVYARLAAEQPAEALDLLGEALGTLLRAERAEA